MSNPHPRAGKEWKDRLSLNNLFRKWRYLSRIDDYRDIQGWLTPAEATHLYYFASRIENPDPVVVEIGSWKGKSTYCLARALEGGKVYAIDPFDASGEEQSEDLYQREKGATDLKVQFQQNMEKLGISEKVFPLKGFSKDYVDRFDSIDLLFIDGDHSIEGCRFDYEQFSPKVVRGGFVLFHDYRPRKPDSGPTWVVDRLVLPGGEFEKMGVFGSLWVGRKR